MRSDFITFALAASAVPAAAYSIPRDAAVGWPSKFGSPLRHIESRSAAPQPATYQPINPAVFRPVSNLAARDEVEFSHLSPKMQAELIFGSPGPRGQIHLANMTLYAEDGLPIVMMERFEGLTSAVDCEGDDGRMSLTFRTQAAYKKAIETWSYINEDADTQFLMITNHAGCGPDHERQVYKIINVNDVDKKATVYLAAKPVSWKEVAGNFDLDFGKATLTREARRALIARGFLDWIDDAVDAVGDAWDSVVDTFEDLGNVDFSKSLDVPISVGQENTDVLLFTDTTNNPPLLNLYCSNCFVSGTFHATGTLKVEHFVPESLMFEVQPQDFRAAVELRSDFTITTPEAKPLHWEKVLFEAPIPNAGFVIPKILSIGARFQFKISGDLALIGKASLTVGARTSLANTARVAFDFFNFDNNDVSGFDVNFEPVFELNEATVTANIAAGPKPAIVFGVEILEDTGIDASLEFGTPTLNLNVTAGYKNGGFCGPSTGAWGAEVVAGANFDMTLAVRSQLDGDVHTLFDKKLLDFALPPLLDKCWDLGGDSTTPPGNTTTPPGNSTDPGDDSGDYPTDAYPSDVYYRNDCNGTSNHTSSRRYDRQYQPRALYERAPTCTRIPVVKFSCASYPNACKAMCFSRYCKGQAGAYPDLLHRGATGSSGTRRTQGGYLPPSRTRQPCRPVSSSVPRSFLEKAGWTSMDEFAMALMTEGGRHGDYGPGFRCIAQGENSGAGSKMENLLNVAGITGSNTPSTSNQFDIEFTDIGGLDQDWCQTDDKGKPTSACVNDGYQFIAKWTGSANVFDYLYINDGQGWTGTHT